jgi:pimeloyl-ACP methyl ester carboxylesterase
MPTVHISDGHLHVVDQGSGRTLLLVHGFPLDHSMWQGQIGDLARDYRVLAPDLRGFGRSAVTTGTVSMEQFADDLAALLDALCIRQPVVLCGLSMGGYVAWQFWRRHRSRLAGLIVCDTRAVADTPEGAQLRLATAERVLAEGACVLAATMLEKLFAPSTLTQRPDVIESSRQVILATRPAGAAAAARGLAQRPDVTADLSRIDVPTLVLCGERDAISTVDEMRGIATRIPGAEFVVIPEAGHMAPLENPGPVNTAIRRFLSDLPVAP